MGEWIRVEDRLPLIGDEVLAVCRKKMRGETIRYVGICMMGPAEEWYEVAGTEEEIYTEDVTHWMPLPKLPEVHG